MIEDGEVTRAETFTWFGADSTKTLGLALAAAGDGSRLEVHIVGEKTFLHVIDAQGEPVAVINDSFVCPIDCPKV